MIDSREATWYIPNSIQEVIEAVVTNNIGYKPIRDDVFREGTKATHTRQDGTIIRGYEWLNLNWHLESLYYASVIPNWDDEYQRRLPLFTRMEVIVIKLPQPLPEYPELEPSPPTSN